MSPFDAAGSSEPPPLSDAAYAGIFLAIDPGLTGIRVLGWSGPARDLWVRRMTGLRPGAAIRKMPVSISEDRLLGGLDLAATLASGRAVFGGGILAESHGGFLILAMAERLTAAASAQLAAAIDRGAGITLIALDEGIGQDEIPPAALLDRLAFTVQLAAADAASWPAAATIAAASRALQRIDCAPQAAERLCALAAMMGVRSVRAEIYALRAARAAAALRGGRRIEEADIALVRHRTGRSKIRQTTQRRRSCRKSCSKPWQRSSAHGACPEAPARLALPPALRAAAPPARALVSSPAAHG
jgi:magnesium chelatase subunit D